MKPEEPKRVLFLCSGNYYRSRFAELLFNHLARLEGLAYLADSAGLWPNCQTHNSGSISPHTLAALAERAIPLPSAERAPRDVTQADLEESAFVIALKEAEHRPLVLRLFPELLHRVEFWHVDDVGDAPPSVALPMIELHVQELVKRLARAR